MYCTGYDMDVNCSPRESVVRGSAAQTADGKIKVRELVFPSRSFVYWCDPEGSYLFQVIQIFVVCFLLGDSSAYEFYMPTFRNTVFHLHRQVPAYEDGTDRVFRNVGI